MATVIALCTVQKVSPEDLACAFGVILTCCTAVGLKQP